MPHRREPREVASEASGPTRDKAGASVRAFFALWPDVATRAALATLARDVTNETGGRPPVAHNIHLTLAFLGEVPAARIAQLCAAGAHAAEAVSAFELQLDRVGSFRGSGIAWAGTSAIPGALAQLAAVLGAELAARGFVLDPRPFAVHVTLARRCRKRITAAFATPIVWPVARLALNASDLSRDGPRYHELGGWPLGPRASA